MPKRTEKNNDPQIQVNPELLQVEKQYKRESLIVESQPVLKQAALLIWMSLDVILLAIFVFSLVTYLVVGRSNDKSLISSIGEDIGVMHAISVDRAARPLAIDNTAVLSIGDGAYDLFAEVENTNTQWYATFDYRFTTSQGDSEVYSSTVMPLEKRPIVVIREEFNSRPSNIDLSIENLVWHRVNAGDVPDIDLWLDEHNAFAVENASYNFDVEIEGEEIARTSFTIENNSPYSYWSPEFILLIERAGKVAGVNTVTLSNLHSGEVREVDVNWFGTVPSSGSVRVIPNINYFDESVYMSAGTGVDEDLRDTLQDRRR